MRTMAGAAGALLMMAPLTLVAQDHYSINSADSKIEIHVYKEGVFKAFGHDHVIAAKDISGDAQFEKEKIEEASVLLRVPTKSITVVDPGESEKDRHDVQATMEGDQVLDVGKFPEIVFSSTGISGVKKARGGWELTLAGKLKLHGVEKVVSFPLQVRADGGQLRGEGEISALQTDYGITPVKVGGGAVRVKDKLKITFEIVARKDH